MLHSAGAAYDTDFFLIMIQEIQRNGIWIDPLLLILVVLVVHSFVELSV